MQDEIMRKLLELQQGSNKAAVGLAYPGTEEHEYFLNTDLGVDPQAKLDEIRAFVRNAIAELTDNKVNNVDLFKYQFKIDEYLTLFPIKQEEKGLR